MGKALIDQYSLLHFAVGIIAYFWGISAYITVLVHMAFELVENTEQGIRFINKYLTFWPGGKPYPDTVPNSIMDTLSTLAGWWAARLADMVSRERHLYP